MLAKIISYNKKLELASKPIMILIADIFGQEYLYKNITDKIEKDLIQSINEQLDTIKKREKRILNLYYALNNYNHHTLEAIGKMENPPLTRQQIHPIKKTALRKMRHPYRTEKLFEILKRLNNLD